MTLDVRTAAETYRPEVRFFNGSLDDDYGTGRGSSGIRVTPDNSLESAAILACVRVLAESIAALPVHLYRRLPNGGKERVDDHPLARVLGVQPNGWQTSFEWRETSMAHLCLWGNAYSEVRSGSLGAVSELWPLHPSRMDVERIENGRLRYVYSEPDGRRTAYTQDQIMHVRWLSSDSITGMIPTELCREAIGVARACEMHAARYFGNGARPGVVLETESNLTPEAARELRENWERVHRGPDKNGKTAVLTGGLKAHELGQSNESSQFIEARRFQIEEVCRVYRVPPHLVQSLERATFSNIEQQSLDFVQHTLLGWIRRWESAIARDLLTDESMFIEFDVRGILRGDATTRASYYSTLAGLGVVSVNEIRAWENLNPVEGGDVRMVPLNMRPLVEETAPAAPEPAAPAPAAVDPTTVPAPPPADGAAPAEPAPTEPASDPAVGIADVSLNGAQVASLLEILASLSSGLLTVDGAKAIIESSFPTISPEAAARIVGGVNVGVGVAPAPAPEAASSSDERSGHAGIEEGDWVSWGDGLIGRIDHIMFEGTLNLGDVEIPATPDAPVALVSVWSAGAFGPPVGVAVADLQWIEAPPGFEE